ncbi:MAG: PAS domain S-box protein [Nitrospirae bacterium]|nr:PAS domain S-box protein [Nitrospirota bacterium]
MEILPPLRKKILRGYIIVVAMFAIVAASFFIGAIFIATGVTESVVHSNYDSIEAARKMQRAWSALHYPEGYPEKSLNQRPNEVWIIQFEKSLNFELKNITEPDEDKIAARIKEIWELWKGGRRPLAERPALSGHYGALAAEGSAFAEFAGPQSAAELTRQMNDKLEELALINEKGMFGLIARTQHAGRVVLVLLAVIFFTTFFATLLVVDSVSVRLAKPLKDIAEVLRSKPQPGDKLRLPAPTSLEFRILNEELTLLWERVTHTDQLNLERILRQRNQLETLLSSVEDAIITLDNKGRITHVNQRMAQLIGIGAGTIVGTHWNDMPTVSDNYFKLRDVFRDITSARPPVATSAPLATSAQAPLEAAGAMEARARSISASLSPPHEGAWIETMQDSAIIFDLDTEVPRAHAAMVATGSAVPIAEGLATPAQESAEPSAATPLPTDSGVLTGPGHTGAPAQGKIRSFEARVREVLSSSGERVSTIFLLHDVTEVRQRERLRAEFIGVLSHELKTPVQSLGTAVELLAQKKDLFDARTAFLFDTISSDVARIRSVANQFMQADNIAGAAIRMHFEVVKLSELLAEWLRPFELLAAEHNVALQYTNTGDETIWADIDPVKFPWVISNLISNSLRVSPQGSVVNVLLTNRRGYTEIGVTNDGPSIPDEIQRRMFDPYFKGMRQPLPEDQATTEKVPATHTESLEETSGESGGSSSASGTAGAYKLSGYMGLGLTIVKEVTEAHGGRVQYTPLEPQGSCFRVLLPLYKG